ncbi:MAG TPA: thiol peroxidase [Nitrospirales bacterium]|nr:thiol peroxidase [Nitrospiraceae bacterium]HNP29666.1 thiol peroxidase [Nitrospirales bacterium]
MPMFSLVSLLLIVTASSLSSCSALGLQTEQGFSYNEIPVDTETARTGEGSTILFRGTPLPLSGFEVKAGDSLRAVPLAKADLSLVNIHESQGRIRIINVVPSLDTKVCEQQTHYLSEKNQGLDQQVKLMTISIDTPFAQDRFAKEAGITNVEFLSDFRAGEFGASHGLLLEGPHVLARAVMVVDKNNVIRHLQVTPDLGHMPDMDRAFQVARALLEN